MIRHWFSWLAPKGAYRPDIDGLRALAVLAVLIFHAFPRSLPGGFVGVDIFFVISGFLISTILFREMDTGTYRYSVFMSRRIRRIFPALCTVLVSVIIAGWLLLNQKEFLGLGKEVVAGSAFFANILFWSQNGYFDTASEFKPLLHLWSLGVEEQFYIFYPPLLWLMFRLRWRLPRVLLIVFVGSLFWGILATKAAPAFAFFMLPPRFWELLCGGLVAFWMSHDSAWLGRLFGGASRAWLRHTASLLGLLMIGIAVALTREANFPGYWALLPTLGAGLFILAGPMALPNRLLFSFRPVVGIGLISYPLYLWHWPILSFEHILSGGTPAPGYRSFAVVTSILLSALTYFVIEKPVRGFSIAKTYRFLLPAGVAAALLGAMIVAGNGFASRDSEAKMIVNEGEIDHTVFHEYGNQHFLECQSPELRANALRFEGKTLHCHQSRPGTDYDVILLGDSHAEHLFYGLATLLPEKNIVYAINFGLPVSGNPGLEKIYQHLLRKPAGKRVDLILGGAWYFHLHEANVAEGIKSSVKQFQHAGYRVFLTDDVPVFPFSPSICKMNRRLSLRGHKCTEKSESMNAVRDQIRQMVSSIAAESGATLLRTHEFFVQNEEYFMATEGKILYRDENHLNVNGSIFLARKLEASGQLGVFRTTQ